MRVLVTGGAGFIGSHLVDLLLSEGHEVIVIDNLDPQVHGPGQSWPSYLPPRTRLRRVLGDIRKASVLQDALLTEDGTGMVDAVVHLAAKVGVGQGQYRIVDYYSVNVTGTALLLQEMAAHAARLGVKIPRLFVAGSMSSYGEGLYLGEDGVLFRPPLRDQETMAAGDWRVRWRGRPLGDSFARPTPETEPLHPASFYASTKAEQERMALIFGETYGVPVWVGRFFNCYGTRQALGNPYTGVVAIFANQIKAGESPTVYEDGRQTRDFINVQDLVRGISLLVQGAPSTAGVYNISTGIPTSVHEVAQAIAQVLGVEVSPKVTGRFRSGDIRHCIGDSSKLRTLGWAPRVTLQNGLEVLFDWLRKQPAQAGLQGKVHEEMKARDLIA